MREILLLVYLLSAVPHAANPLSVRSVQLVDGTGVELGRPTGSGIGVSINRSGSVEKVIVEYSFAMKEFGRGGRRRVLGSEMQIVKIGEDSKLKIGLELGKQIVNVPFKIKNIPLVLADQ